MSAPSTVEVLIDGRPVSAGWIEFLYQRDPCPGDLRYSLRLAASGVARRLPKLAAGDVSRLPSARIQEVFQALAWEIARIVDVPREARYFVNNIDALTVTDHEITISGVASASRRSRADG